MPVSVLIAEELDSKTKINPRPTPGAADNSLGEEQQ